MLGFHQKFNEYLRPKHVLMPVWRSNFSYADYKTVYFVLKNIANDKCFISELESKY